MGLIKKNIVLSPANYDGVASEKGILSVEKTNGKIRGNLKCFNIPDLEGKMLLGVTINDGKLHKFNVDSMKIKNFNFDLVGEDDIDKKISCVVVNLTGNNSTPIIWGSTQTNKLWKAQVMDAFEIKAQEQKEFQVKSFDKNIIKELKEESNDEYIDDEVEALIDKEVESVNKELFEDSVKKKTKPSFKSSTEKQKEDFIEYKKVFEQPKVASPFKILEENEQEEYEQEASMFYDLVRDQVEELFEKFPEEKALEEIIPDSKFIRVDYNEDGEYYIFGLIYDETGEVEYLVYGMPATYTSEPPLELEGYYQWLPLDVSKPEEDGYWMMYQSAHTGENIKIEMV